MAFVLATPRRRFLPYNTLGLLASAREIHTYPSLEALLQILTTGPVTTATNENVRLVL